MADLKLSDSPNVDTVYVTTDDGKQHKAKLVANLPTDNLELSDSPNVLYGYATINGKKHRVLLTAVVHDGDVVRKSETMMQTLSGPLSVTDEICLIDREDQTAKYSVAMVAGIPTETAEEMDIIGNRKFDVSPTSDETTAYSNLNPQKLITKGQIAPVITDLNDKINLAATSGNLIGSYWFGKSETGFTPPNPTDASQNYFDFTTNTPYTAKADLSGWDAGTPIGNPTVDSQIQITSKFWNIPEQADQQGGTAYWAHSSNEWSYAPKIISFESPNLSGTPTAPDLTADSPDAQIVNKNALQTATTELSNAISALSTTVDTKANQSDLTALSSTVSTLQATVGTKADSATVTSELATKATKATDFITPLTDENKGATQTEITELEEKISKAGKIPMLKREVSTFKFNDVSYLNANTFSWQNGSMYLAAYQHLVDDLSTAGAVQTVTIEGVTISYEVATDGHRICLPTQETAISQLYAKTGEADFYILDTENARFKLPRTQKRKLIRAWKSDNGQSWYNLYSDGWVEQGGIGKPMPDAQQNFTVGLPCTMANSTYTLCVVGGTIAGEESSYSLLVNESAITTTSFGYWVYENHAKTSNAPKIGWQVSGYAADSVLANEPIQYEYYYVGNFEQSSIEQTAGINAELFNAKADVDLANVSTAGKSAVAKWGMPSNSYIDLTLGESGAAYTAPGDGWFILNKDSSAAQQYLSGGVDDIWLDVVWSIAPNLESVLILPALKGSIARIYYSFGGATRSFRFIYAEGAKPNS